MFKKYQKMNSLIILEPLIKQINIRYNMSYIINTFDIQFFENICQHKSLNATISI